MRHARALALATLVVASPSASTGCARAQSLATGASGVAAPVPADTAALHRTLDSIVAAHAG